MFQNDLVKCMYDCSGKAVNIHGASQSFLTQRSGFAGVTLLLPMFHSCDLPANHLSEVIGASYVSRPVLMLVRPEASPTVPQRELVCLIRC